MAALRVVCGPQVSVAGVRCRQIGLLHTSAEGHILKAAQRRARVLIPQRRRASSPVSAFAIASVVFGFSFGAALIGMILHVILPDRHLDSDSRDVVKLVMGLIATMSALVLSLLIASANSSYDQQSNELKALSANIILLDRTLESYGPGAQGVRDRLRDVVRQTHDRIWSPDGVRPEVLNSIETQSAAKANIGQLQSL